MEIVSSEYGEVSIPGICAVLLSLVIQSSLVNDSWVMTRLWVKLLCWYSCIQMLPFWFTGHLSAIEASATPSSVSNLEPGQKLQYLPFDKGTFFQVKYQLLDQNPHEIFFIYIIKNLFFLKIPAALLRKNYLIPALKVLTDIRNVGII